HRVEAKTLGGPRYTQDRFAARSDVRRQHHAETHGAEFMRGRAASYRTVVPALTTRTTIKTEALIAKIPSSNTAKTSVPSRVPKSTGRFSIRPRSLLIREASPPSGGVRRYPQPDRG